MELTTPEGYRFHMYGDDLKWGRYRALNDPSWKPAYSRWRHGGSYVDNLYRPSGAVGCIASARHTVDGLFRIACDPRPEDQQVGYRTREEAAYAEREMVLSMWRTLDTTGENL